MEADTQLNMQSLSCPGKKSKGRACAETVKVCWFSCASLPTVHTLPFVFLTNGRTHLSQGGFRMQIVMTAAEISKSIECDEVLVNGILETMWFQSRVGDKFIPTEKGLPFCSSHNGEILWFDTVKWIVLDQIETIYSIIKNTNGFFAINGHMGNAWSDRQK